MNTKVVKETRLATEARRGLHAPKKKRLPDVALGALFLVGLLILAYPIVSDYWNSLQQGKAVARYDDEVAKMTPEDFSAMWREVEAYNEELKSSMAGFHLSDEQLERYNSLLNLAGSGMMGHIEIAKLGVDLPVYHTVDDAVLQTGIGHIPGSSLPAGGEGTHVLLSGHRGLPTSTLFTNLDKLGEGDLFVLHVLDRTLTYQVDQIRIVEPHEVQDLDVVDGQDYVTLITCTPYAINTHRLLVRGHRVENVDTQYLPADAVRMDPVLVSSLVAAPILILLLTLYVTHVVRRRRRERSSEGEAS